jgi:flagellar protein FliO/FliZ
LGTAVGLAAPYAFAQNTSSVTEISQIASIFFALLLIIGLIILLAFVAKKLNLGSMHSEHIKIVASMTTGSKERLVIVEVAGEQLLLGVTPHHIGKLHTLATPIQGGPTGKNAFQQSLVKALAGKINPNPTGDKHE